MSHDPWPGAAPADALNGDPVDPSAGGGWAVRPDWSAPSWSSPTPAPVAWTPPTWTAPGGVAAPYAPPPAFAPPEYRGLIGGPPAPPGYPNDLRPSWAAPGYIAYPQPSPGRKRVWVAVAAFAAVLIAAISLVAANGGSSRSSGPAQRALSLPDAAAGYQHLLDSQSQNLVDQVRDRIATLSGQAQAVYDQAVIGLYAQTAGDPQVVFVGVERNTNSATRNLFDNAHGNDPASSVLSGTGASGVMSYPAGPLGGSLDCGTLASSQNVVACVWFDDTTLGLLLDVTGVQDQGNFAGFARTFRSLAEH